MDTMAKKYQARLYDRNGEPLKWVRGDTVQELVNNAVTATLDSIIIVPGSNGEQMVKPISFESYSKEWQSTFQSHIRPTTRRSQNSLLGRHLIPAFGNMNIRDITISGVQDMINEKAKRGLSKKTIKEIRVLLGSILQCATEEGIISTNPVRSKRITVWGDDTDSRRALTTDQLAAILGDIGKLSYKTDRRYLSLLAYLGLRPEEVRGLKACDFDLGKSRLSINRAVTFISNEPVIGPTKTTAGKRTVIIPEQLKQWLELTEKPNEFIFGGDAPSSEHTFRYMWKRICRTIELYGATPRTFRHTFATQGKRAGIIQKTMQSIGGWKDSDILNNVYTHTQDEDLEIAKRQIDLMFDSMVSKPVSANFVANF